MLRQHGKDCRKVDAQIVELPEKKNLLYCKFRHEVEISISIGADFECALSDVAPDDPLAPASAKQHHVPVTVALKVSSEIFPSMDLPVRSHIWGPTVRLEAREINFCI